SIEKLPAKWMGIGGLVLFLFGSTIGFYGFPALIKSQISSNLALKKDSEIREMWSNFPDGIDFKIYVFNYTNPMEVQKGGKPVLHEIGPYFYYHLNDKKINLKDIEKEDVVLFNPKDTWQFVKEKSGRLTGDEIITIPHATLLAMAVGVEMEKPAALKLVNKAIPFIFGQPSSIFLTTQVRKILFEGVPIYCNVTDFSAKAICSEIRKKESEFHNLGQDIFGFSFFGIKNGSVGGRFKVRRGVKNVKQVGEVVAFNEENMMSVWSGDDCNTFKGTDSTIFPPFMTHSDKITAFAPDLCRSIAADFKEEVMYKGIKGFKFAAGFGDMSTDPALKCFCTTPETCWKRGLHDLTRCLGAPIIASLPHFYDSDPEYQNGVIGLNPNQEDHGITMIFEPLTATPLVAYKRLQFNVPIHPIDKIDLMKEVPTVLLPILWVQEGLELKQEFIDKVASIFTIMGAVGVMKWIMMVLGGGLGAAGAAVTYMKKNTEMNIQRTSPNSLELKKGSDIRQIWSDIPDPIPFKIYLFNITNPMDVQQGKKPVLQEIGPYYFEEHKEKVNIEDFDKDDTVAYNPKDTWTFKIDKSNGLTGNEIITFPNVLLAGMAMITAKDKPAALNLINKSFKQIFNDPTSIFVTASAMQIMFTGVPFHCNVTEFSAKVICGELRKNENEFHKLEENIYGVSLFGTKNGTARDRLKVKRGTRNIKHIGLVMEHNGKTQMEVWDGEECNRIFGTDTTIFPPFLTNKDNILAYAFDLCRSMISYNEGETTFKRIKGYSFSSGFGDMSTDPKLKCFCTTPDTCLKKGMHDLTRCV
ncbi:hypothetical protein L9F63_016887, partial [Diploptera punctata]